MSIQMSIFPIGGIKPMDNSPHALYDTLGDLRSQLKQAHKQLGEAATHIQRERQEKIKWRRIARQRGRRIAELDSKLFVHHQALSDVARTRLNTIEELVFSYYRKLADGFKRTS